MPQNTNPIFILEPTTVLVTVTADTTDRSAAVTGETRVLVTAGVNGTKITQIGYKFQGTSSLGNILIFVSDNTGQNLRLFDEIQISSVTPSLTTPSGRNVTIYDDFQIESGQIVVVGATVVLSDINIFASKADY
jgi:hypothetical protein